MSETSVGSHLEESLHVFSELGFEDVRGHLQVLALLVVADSVEEPTRYSVPFGVVDDVGDAVAVLLVELACSDPRVDPEDLADEEAEPPADSLDLFEGEGDGPLAVDVGVEDTVDVLKVGVCVFDDERHAVVNIILNIYINLLKKEFSHFFQCFSFLFDNLFKMLSFS